MELPKGRAVSASPWDMIANVAVLGVRVDVSRNCGDGLDFVSGEPHRDVVVADAIRALSTEARVGKTMAL